MSAYIADRFEIDAATPVGGKARALAELANAGLPVPTWFVVLPSAFDASVTPALAAALAQAPGEAALSALAAGIRLAPEVEAAINAALGAAAATDRYAVRSSAQDEDGERHSFAGQLESFLDVPGLCVADHVARVWASGFGARLARYRTEAGLDGGTVAPAVVVQQMIDGDASGVAFSADPVSGRRAITVVAAAKGRGAALVSGEVEGETWRIDRAGRIVERPSGVAPAVLADADVLRVVALAHAAERHFGAPQDIEWSLAQDTLHLLQSRPITTLADRADPDAARAIWDNANIVESYGGLTTPLTFSFARRCYEQVYREFCRLVGVPARTVEAHAEVFACMLGLVRGRVYYNLCNWYRLLAMLPGYAVNRQFMEQMMGVRERMPTELAAESRNPGRGARLRGTLALAGMLGLLAWRIATLPSRMRAFHARLDDSLGGPRPDLAPMRPDELAAYYRRLEGRLLVHWDAPIVNDFATMVFHGLLRRLCTTWLGDDDRGLANDLLCGERGLASEVPAQRVREIAAVAASDAALVALLCDGSLPRLDEALRARPALRAAFDAYIARYGERCIVVFKLESATLFDDPLPLYRAVGRCARGASAPTATDRAGGGPRAQAERRVGEALRRQPLRRIAFGWVLRRARAHVRDRENLRFERTRVFGRARQIVVELGKRLAAIDCINKPRDVFFLEFDEVLAFAENRATTTDLKGLVSLREAEWASFRTLPPPPERFETRGIACRGHAFEATRPVPPPDGEAITGIACCPGIVRASVRLVRDPQRTNLQPGEIIVAERTDPGWVMVFPAAGGLLVERGSLLSHSAIVARELGIPTIVSLPGVTHWLRDGDRVEMDGGTGKVTRLPSDTPASHVRHD
jgi:phosphohistidine swiveling domain-containing protein